MHFSDYEYVLWVAGSLLYFTLVVMICVKRQYRYRPYFAALAGFTLLSSTVLFWINREFSGPAYDAAFWLAALIDIALETAVLLEFGRHALQHNWVTGTKTLCLILFVGSLAVASCLTYYAQLVAATRMDSIFARIELFSTFFPFLLAVSLSYVSISQGSQWNSTDFRLFASYVIGSTVSALTDTFHAYWRMTHLFSALDALRTLTTFGMVVWWIATIAKAREDEGLIPAPATEEINALLLSVKRARG